MYHYIHYACIITCVIIFNKTKQIVIRYDNITLLGNSLIQYV